MSVLVPVERADSFNRFIAKCKRLKEWKGEGGSGDLYACGKEYVLVVHTRGGTLAGFSSTLAGAAKLALQAYPELGGEVFALVEALFSD